MMQRILAEIVGRLAYLNWQPSCHLSCAKWNLDPSRVSIGRRNSLPAGLAPASGTGDRDGSFSVSFMVETSCSFQTSGRNRASSVGLAGAIVCACRGRRHLQLECSALPVASYTGGLIGSTLVSLLATAYLIHKLPHPNLYEAQDNQP
jgi:hypothetical protein